VRFLVDEMFSPEVARHLSEADHDAVHVSDVDLRATADHRIVAYAAEEDRVVVTENAADYVPIIEARTAGGVPVPPVVIALRRNLPRQAGVLAAELARRLEVWAEEHPSPYRHVHWLG
jgi:predicted nuclease of predicted toxin-antitoxin system